jgi:hypothetical protein
MSSMANPVDFLRRYFSSALACTKYTFHTEGLRGFFAGLSSLQCGIVCETHERQAPWLL